MAIKYEPDVKLEDLIDEITEEAHIACLEHWGCGDEQWEEREFFNEVRRRIQNREPGWKLLTKEYGEVR